MTISSWQLCLIVLASLSVGACFGYMICAILSANKKSADATPIGTLEWLRSLPPLHAEQYLYNIVGQFFNGKRHIHKNPTPKG
jgi:hypothetical protein